jgi:anti-sigma factor RsiW
VIELLENNEVILLMYLADELPPVDRAEVTQMLASDANLRAALGQLQSAYEGAQEGLRSLDASSRATQSSENAAVRRVMRAVCRQLAAPPVVPTPVVEPRKLHYPWWAYPTAAAAAILLAFLTWWGNHGGMPASYDNQPMHLSYAHIVPDDSNVKLAEEVERTFKTNNDPDIALLALRDDAPRMGDQDFGGDPDE